MHFFIHLVLSALVCIVITGMCNLACYTVPKKQRGSRKSKKRDAGGDEQAQGEGE